MLRGGLQTVEACGRGKFSRGLRGQKENESGESGFALQQGGFAEGLGADSCKERGCVEVGGVVGEGEVELRKGDEIAEDDGSVFHVGRMEAGGAVAEHTAGIAQLLPLTLETVDVGVAGEVQGDFDALRAGVSG